MLLDRRVLVALLAVTMKKQKQTQTWMSILIAMRMLPIQKRRTNKTTVALVWVELAVKTLVDGVRSFSETMMEMPWILFVFYFQVVSFVAVQYALEIEVEKTIHELRWFDHVVSSETIHEALLMMIVDHDQSETAVIRTARHPISKH